MATSDAAPAEQARDGRKPIAPGRGKHKRHEGNDEHAHGFEHERQLDRMSGFHGGRLRSGDALGRPADLLSLSPRRIGANVPWHAKAESAG